jgi:hypothetical protein
MLMDTRRVGAVGLVGLFRYPMRKCQSIYLAMYAYMMEKTPPVPPLPPNNYFFASTCLMRHILEP